jgi:endo-1,4-beta-xylanase
MNPGRLSRRDALKAGLSLAAGASLAAIGCSGEEEAAAEPTAEMPARNTPIPPSPTAIPEPTTLRGWAQELDIDFGCQFTGWWFNDSRWREVVAREFSLGVVQWGINWPDLEPERERFNTSTADRLIQFGEQRRLRLRGHPILFPSQLPDWLSKGTFSRQELTDLTYGHIRRLMGAFAGRIREWVVVNEPYIQPFRTDDIFHSTIGPGYIEMAFEAARGADPAAELIYNDTENHTAAGIMTELTRRNLAALKARSVVDGVGLQMHLKASSPPAKSDIAATMKSYELPVYCQ